MAGVFLWPSGWARSCLKPIFRYAHVMDFHVWLTYFVAAWVIALSPGSGAVLCMSHGLAYGVKKTSATVLGLQIGLSIVLLIAGVGVGAILVASATAFLVIKIVGAAYLIYLGIKQWRAPTAEPAVDVPEPSALQQRLPQGLTPFVPDTKRRILTGMLTNLSNPKGIVFMVAVLPQFIDPNRSLALQLLILCLTMNVVDSVVMHGYAYLASQLQHLLRTVKARVLQNRVFGGVLIFMGGSLFFVRRAVT
jgi:homoserine/homoserine lactone efflux protein